MTKLVDVDNLEFDPSEFMDHCAGYPDDGTSKNDRDMPYDLSNDNDYLNVPFFTYSLPN